MGRPSHPVAGLAALTLAWPQRLAVLWLALVVLTALLAPVLPLPYPPGAPDLAHVAQFPLWPAKVGGAHHWLGTDAQGRDVLSLVVFGARTAVFLTLPAALLAALLGAVAGGAAGFWGNTARVAVPYWLLAASSAWWALSLPLPGIALALALLAAIMGLLAHQCNRVLPTWPMPINAVTMGVATTLDTIPRLLLVVVLAAGPGVSAFGLLLLLTLTAWPHPARLVRGQMLRVQALPFIDAALAAGIPSGRIWLRHALPHAVQPLRTALPLSIAALLGLESTLSFLGIGLPPDVASWGRLLATVREEPGAWWAFGPAFICLTFSIICLNKLSSKLPHKDWRPPANMVVVQRLDEK